MAIAVVIILLVFGSLAFHFLSPWWFTPIASNWGTMDTTVDITFWVTGIVFVLVNLFMAYAVIRYRHRKGQRAEYEPENKKLEWWLTVVTSVGVAAMLTPGLFVWAQFVRVPDGAAVVEAVGRQWTWSFRLPGRDGELGATSAELITADNPFGLDPNDRKGRDDVLVNAPELHLPLGQPVKVLLRSKDVLHNFTVPQFRVKMDLVPGMVTYLWMTPTRTGNFEILCEELCGLAHFAMRGSVVVDEEDAYRSWLAGQPTFSQTMAIAEGDPAAGQTAYATCLACHGPNGEGNEALNAPRLAGQSEWYLSRQLRNFRDGLRGAHDDDAYGKQMVAFAALLDDESTRNVMAFLDTLPVTSGPVSVAGDVDRGEKIYASNCAVCHGRRGEGIWSTNAPRLAQMDDWYIATQLENFRRGIRGGHPQDRYGAQMAMMADVVSNERMQNDVIAYINTLRRPERMTAADINR